MKKLIHLFINYNEISTTFRLLVTKSALCCAVIFQSYAQGDPNILVGFPGADPGFETGASIGLWGGSIVTQGNAQTGQYSAQLEDNSQWGGGIEMQITGLSPATNYGFSAFVKLSGGGTGSIGVKGHGDEEMSVGFSNTSYEQKKITFTTGAISTSARVYVYNPPGGDNLIYADDLELVDMGPGEVPVLDPIDTSVYTLIFSDEFEVDGSFDNTKWSHERGFKRNNEAQYYLPDNVVQKDGNLVVFGKREQFANENYDPNSSDWKRNRQYADWTSGSINTFGRFNFLYGRVECRAKVTNLTGTWPAIWTVGEYNANGVGCQTGEWPAAGEIDIMENYGGKILGNFAVSSSGRYSASWDARSINVSEFGDPDFADKYHVWTLDWTESKMTIYIDGILVNEFDPNTQNNSGAYACPGNAPFKNTAQVLWLNLALGGNAGGTTSGLSDSTVYLVDYIRVYQKGQDDASNARRISSLSNMLEDATITGFPEIQLFPNPSSNKLTIIPEDQTEYPYSIGSLNGSVVEQGVIKGKKAIDISGFNPGVYLFKLLSESKEQVWKFVVK